MELMHLSNLFTTIRVADHFDTFVEVPLDFVAGSEQEAFYLAENLPAGGVKSTTGDTVAIPLLTYKSERDVWLAAGDCLVAAAVHRKKAFSDAVCVEHLGRQVLVDRSRVKSDFVIFRNSKKVGIAVLSSKGLADAK